MMDEHRGFRVYGNAGVVMKNLIESSSDWYPKGSIDYVRRNHSIVELTRFQLESMTFDEREAAEMFGLELARLLLDTSYREFAIARYETEKRVIKQSRNFRR